MTEIQLDLTIFTITPSVRDFLGLDVLGDPTSLEPAFPIGDQSLACKSPIFEPFQPDVIRIARFSMRRVTKSGK